MCRPLPARIAGSNFTGGGRMGVYLLLVLCFVQVQLSGTGRSLVQRSPTDSMFVMECDQVKQQSSAPTMGR